MSDKIHLSKKLAILRLKKSIGDQNVSIKEMRLLKKSMSDRVRKK